MSRIEYDLQSLLQEIPGSEDGVGADISLGNQYDQIKEARREEDPRLSMGVWERELKKADWPLVESLTVDVLQNTSKDLQVFAWLIESIINMEKFSGIAKALQLLRAFLESFWYTCFPKDEEEKSHILYWIEDRINNIVLTSSFAEDISLYDYEYALEMKSLSKRSAEIEIEIAEQTKRENRKTIEELQHIIEKTDHTQLNADFNAIDQAIKILLDTAGKIFKDKYSFTLTKVVQNIQKIRKLITNVEMQSSESKGKTSEIAKSEAVDRNQIYGEIKNLSTKLKQIERHSPAPFLLDLVVTWKDKTLFEIMKDLQEGTGEGHNLLKILIKN